MNGGRLGVVGAGTMGAGIAQLGCLGGFDVTLHDSDPQALATGADRLQAAYFSLLSVSLIALKFGSSFGEGVCSLY